MKNAVIVILGILVLAIGVYLFTSNDNSSETSSETSSPSTSSAKQLSLADSGLTNLDTGIFDDASIVVLNVSGNSLTGSLPSEIGKLKKLEELYASDNLMTGVPAEVGQLSKLRIIDYSNNDLSGLPFELGNLSNLVLLDLRGNPNISTQDLGQIQQKIPNAEILTD